MFLVYVDGACRPNPGIGAYAYIIRNSQGEEVERGNGVVGKYVTNNIAEYTAVNNALAAAIKLGIKNLTVHSDSQLVVNQINGEYGVKDANMRVLFTRTKELTEAFNIIIFKHIKRAQNEEADKLAGSVFKKDNTTRKDRAEEIAKDVFVKIKNKYIYLKENKFYIIDLKALTCTCPDRVYGGGLCKHIMAAQIIEESVKKIAFEILENVG